MFNAAATDVRYFARNKFFGSLGYKKMFGFTYFVKGCRIPLLSLNELREKLQATIILSIFVNKP